MRIGIDLGATLTKVIVYDAGIIHREIHPRDVLPEKILSSLPKADIFATGGRSKALQSAAHVDELDSIPGGALHLSQRKEALIVTIGTGTSIISARRERTEHLGGTGVGGGTLQGLASRLLGTKDVDQITRLAQSGTSPDLSIGEIMGAGIGVLPADITASNLAKLDTASREDTAMGLISMVAETIASVSVFALRSSPNDEIIFTGTLSTNKLLRKRISKVLDLFKIKHIFIDDAEYSTALGAVL